MDTFIARQPIMDKNNKVFGFELLFRDSNINIYNSTDGDEATLDVIRNIFFNIDMHKITGNKTVFLNFTANLLKSDIIDLIPSETTAIEMLEDIELDKDIIDACIRLKHKGFLLVLGGFKFQEKYKELIQLVDIIKIDFRTTKGLERRNILKRVDLKNVKFLAEKVETIEEFNEAVLYGYSLFQGNYFSKPIMMSSKKIPESKLLYLNLLNELNSTELNFDNIEGLVRKDISMVYKVLKIINSAYFGIQNDIKSLRQALTLLGEKEIKIWLDLIIMKNISSNKPNILLQNSLIRAKFCELIAINSSIRNVYDNAYLMGMLSLIDVILDKPMNEIVNEMIVPDVVGSALIGLKTSSLRNILNIVIAYEYGNWNEVLLYSKEFQLSDRVLSSAYIESCEWVDKRLSFSGHE